jgi:tetratricopeptide (TPR) repeat protein
VADEARLTKLRALVEMDPSDAFSRYALAMELRGLGRADEARAELAGLIASDPDYVASYYHYARLLDDDGDGDQALDVIRQGIEAATRAGDDHARSELNDLLEELG